MLIKWSLEKYEKDITEEMNNHNVKILIKYLDMVVQTNHNVKILMKYLDL
jgi:hypothetical protein